MIDPCVEYSEEEPRKRGRAKLYLWKPRKALQKDSKMKLKICPDFESSGIWDSDEMMVEFEDIHLPHELVREFKAWLEFYEEKCHDKDYAFLENSAYAHTLNEWGLALARKVKAVYPGDEVVYVGEVEDAMLEPVEV